MKHRRLPATRFAFTLATAMAAFFCNQSAEAATITWSGGHTTGSWANSNNWGGATFANNDDVVFATGAARSLSFLAGARTVNSITFQSGNGMANISLGSVGSAGQGGTAHNLTFRSGNTGINIVSGNTTNINIGTGGLTGGTTPNSFGNVVLAGNLSVAHNGSGTLTIDRPVTGAFAVTKSGAGTMVLSGSNTFTGGVTINAGTVRLATPEP
jgi:autotransporter-associated beta strand protein